MNQHYSIQPANRRYQPTMTSSNLLSKQNSNPLIIRRPNLLSPISAFLLTSPPHNHSKPKPPRARTHFTQTNLHHNNNFSSTLHPPSLFILKPNTLLHCIRSHSNPNPHPHYPMRQPTRTIKRRHLPAILHTRQFPPTINYNHSPT